MTDIELQKCMLAVSKALIDTIVNSNYDRTEYPEINLQIRFQSKLPGRSRRLDSTIMAEKEN